MFKMLGVTFEGALSMHDTISEVVAAAGWKLRTLLRTRRYYTSADLIKLYKAHLLSWLEYQTPAIYHVTRALLRRVDGIQSRFLLDIGIDEVTALMEFNLAPLQMRRDLAMLGVLHRAALGQGPPQLRKLFRRKPGSTLLIDPFETAMPPIVRRSAWGLISVYNRLGGGARSIMTVKDFQWSLQERAKT